MLRAVSVALVGAALFVAGIFVGGHPQDTGLTRLPDGVRSVVLGNSGQDLSAQVLDVLRDRYYRDFDVEAGEQASVDALVESLDDPFTVYLDPDELAALRDRTNGRFQGVGLTVEQRGDQIIVTSVFEGSPAEEAGILPGDRIAVVDGTPVKGQSIEQVVARVRGPAGSTVDLRLVRPGQDERIDVTVERAEIALEVVRSRVERVGGQRVGYLRLTQFTRGAGAELREGIEELGAQGVSGFVLDLRGDPGGLVSEAVAVGSVFLPDDTLIATTEGRRVPRQELRAKGDPLTTVAPLAVLVDGGSASASEIVSGALLDHDCGTIVGTKTFGKALVQSTVALRDGGALKLTTAQYETPDGRDINETGIEPEVEAEDDPETPRDEALDAALAVVAGSR